MAYVRRTYGVPVRRGGRVSYTNPDGWTRFGTITRATNYVFVRFDSNAIVTERRARPFHPTDPGLVYLDNPTPGATP